MAAPIFKFKNVRTRLTTTDPTPIYGVVVGGGLDAGISPSDVSAVLLTVQCANIDSTPVGVTVSVTDGSSQNALVSGYPIPPNNAFDPLSGNLVLTSGTSIVVTADRPSAVDVIISLLEIANAPSS